MGISLPISAVIDYICAVIKPRLGSDKTGFHSLKSEETDIVTLKLNWECGWFPFNCGLWQSHFTWGEVPRFSLLGSVKIIYFWQWAKQILYQESALYHLGLWKCNKHKIEPNHCVLPDEGGELCFICHNTQGVPMFSPGKYVTRKIVLCIRYIKPVKVPLLHVC